MAKPALSAPYGYDVFTHTEVVPKQPPPPRLRWQLGPVTVKQTQPGPGTPGSPPTERFITMQLTADQQVQLSVEGEDAYGNKVDLTGAEAVWSSSDTSIVAVEATGSDALKANAVAVGPVGTAAVTVANTDGTIQGSLAIDVVAGDVTEIVVSAGEPTDKLVADNSLPA